MWCAFQKYVCVCMPQNVKFQMLKCQFESVTTIINECICGERQTSKCQKC